ncbi:MAG: hypothetical protein KDC92_09455 [Bacteroidetes bacterium]|nr:hypothetical protein [Bacteroidota bacterium]
MQWEEYFDDYLNDTLHQPTLSEFENALAHNIELKNKLNTHKLAREAIARSARNELKATMKSWQVQNKIKTYKMRALASVAATIVIFMMVYFGLKEPSASKVFEAYYSTYPNVVTHRGNAGLTHKALELYSMQQYKEFVEYLENQSQTSDTLHFYKALAHMELKNFYKAIDEFSKVEFIESSPLVVVKDYYWALSYLAINNTIEAKKLLNKIEVNTASSYAKKAKAILKQID